MNNPVKDFVEAHAAAVSAIAEARRACEAAAGLAKTPEVRDSVAGYAKTLGREGGARRIADGDTVRPTFPGLHEFAEFDTLPDDDQMIRFTNVYDGQEWHLLEIDVPIAHLLPALVPSNSSDGARDV